MSEAIAADPRDGNPPEPPASKRQIYLIMTGLMLGMLLAMLDNLIVSTALPTIVGDLGGLAHLSWVVTAYALATAVSTPVWGKLGDLRGRKPMFMSAIVVFLAGSALAGLAQNMNELIAFRALQGLGAGGLIVGAQAIIGDIVPPRERGRYQGLIGAMMPVAFIGGPLVGGLLTEHLSWRWVFYVNLPIGIAALIVTGTMMHLPRRRRHAVIDYPGGTLLGIGVIALTLATSWGGSQYSWGSWQIITLAVVSVVALGAFIAVENRAAEPFVPPRLFRSRNFTAAQILSFLVGAAMFGLVNFLPQYMQDVRGASPTTSGLLLLPMMFGMLAVILVTGQVISRTGHYRSFPIIGGAVMAGGMLLLLVLHVNTATAVASALTAVVGLGMGFVMQNTVLITQNSVDLPDMGAATGTASLMRTIGGSLGIALLGSIYTQRLASTLAAHLGAGGGRLLSGSAQLSPAEIYRLPAPVRDAFQAGVVGGLHGVLAVGAVVGFAVFLAAWLVRPVPLRQAPGQDAPSAAATPGPGPSVRPPSAAHP